MALGEWDVHRLMRAMPYSPAEARRQMGWRDRLARWWDRLLGRKRPTRTYRRTSIREWMAYAQLDPFGNERGDLQAALVKQAVLNTMGRGENDDPFELEDCMPRFGESRIAKARREKEKAKKVPEKIRDVFGRL